MSCQISGAIVTQRVGKCHCSVQRLEEGCHTLYRSLFVWLILTGPIHHCWACWLSLQQNHRKHSNFFFPRDGCSYASLYLLWLAAFSPSVCPLCLLFFYQALSPSSCSSLPVFLCICHSSLVWSFCSPLYCSHPTLCVHILVHPLSAYLPPPHTILRTPTSIGYKITHSIHNSVLKT